jgi:small subunit ribosomal protein S16
MLRIRLLRVGLAKQPSYRIVVTDSRKARDGKAVEVVGFYNPRTRPEQIELKEERVLHWLNVGAQPSEAVEGMLKKTGTLDRLGRLRQGETLEKLVEEAKEAMAKIAPSTPKTQYGAPLKSTRKEKAE